MNLKVFFSILFISILCSLQCLSQAEDIEIVPNAFPQLKSSETPASLLSLPFFDDFAYPYSTPTRSLWNGDDVFVNSAFAKNVVTIGVATLDAMAANGKLHENASITAQISDYLTSLPINLKTYEHIYASDKLYKKSGSSYVLLDDTYFLFDETSESYISVTQGVAYRPGDKLYVKSGSNYDATSEYLYDSDQNYIDGSHEGKHIFYNYSLNDSLALSFYYQAGGLVDAPESTDSLVLEFYAPYDTTGIFLNEISTKGIEIYNATESTVSLEGYILKVDETTSITLPAYDVEPFGHIAVSAKQCGKDSLSLAYAYLYTSENALVDSIDLEFPLANDDVYARLTDGNPQWSYTATETLGDCNPSWDWIWSTSKLTGDTFQSAYKAIESEKYLVKGFRFRFKNYTSLSNDKSHARNEDFWHIDLIWLDANRNSQNQNVPDVAFAAEISPLYTKYKAMPMSHFANVSNNEFRLTIPTTFTNFDCKSRKLKFNFDVKKTHTGDKLHFPTYETDLPEFMTASERDILTDFDVDFFDFIAEDIDVYDAGKYEFQYYFTDINNPLYSQYRWNDTCRTTLTLDNYYAYDDGIPEAGYGLRDAPMGKVAFKFDILESDTLKSIGMYFNPTLLENTTTFNLCVWANNNGYPGTLLYYSPSEKVQYANGLYEFVHYDIRQENIVSGNENLVVPKTFFIGWEQPNDVLLNLGLDLNANLNNRLFYNLGFEWENSVQTGALLMRPYFGNYTPQAGIELINKKSVLLYPTVAKNEVSVLTNEIVKTITVFNSVGTKVLKTNNTEFSVEPLSNGCYTAVITLLDGQQIYKKLIVVK